MIRCSIKAKSFLNVFRLSDTIEYIELKIDIDNNCLKITNCEVNGIKRRYCLPFNFITTLLQVSYICFLHLQHSKCLFCIYKSIDYQAIFFLFLTFDYCTFVVIIVHSNRIL